MQKILLALVAITLGACAHQPFVEAPKIAPLNITPVKTGNQEIATGNRAIATGNEAVRTKLEDTRSKLDGAIITANELTIDGTKLRADLKAVSESLNAAVWENANLKVTIGSQDSRISVQEKTIDELAQANEERQKVIDLQTKNLNETRQLAADQKKIVDEVNKYWGLGAFFYGAKRLGWRLLLVAIGLSVIGFLLNMFVPFLQPFFAGAVRFIISIPGKIGRFVMGLFKRKPPS